MKTKTYANNGTGRGETVVRQALEAMLRGPKYHGVVGFACNLCGDREFAIEMVQKACYRALRAAATFRGEGTGFDAWFFTIVRNIYRDWLRRAERRNVSISEDVDALAAITARRHRGVDSEDLLGLLESETDRQLVSQAVLELPEIYRLPVILCEFEGASYRDAAFALRIPIETFRSRFSRAKKKLRESPYLRQMMN